MATESESDKPTTSSEFGTLCGKALLSMMVTALLAATAFDLGSLALASVLAGISAIFAVLMALLLVGGIRAAKAGR